MESTPLLPKSVTQPAANETQQTSKVNIFIGGVTLSVVFLFALIAAVRVHMSHSDNLMKVIPFPHISHPDPPSSLWGTVARPFPTGAFWTNVAIGKGDSPIGLYPYSVKCLEEGIQVGYGAATRHITQLSIYDDYVADMLLSSKEAYVSRGVDSYDFASVTMAYQTATGGGFKAPLVKGSAFVTVVYTKTTPVISSDLMHIVKFEKKEAPHGQPGVAYLVVLGNWMNWVVYCSEDVEFVKTGDKLVASKPIDGYVRIAYLPPFSTTALPLLLEYANRYPVGASFSYVTEDSTSILTYHFKSLGSGSLLMLALPHHVSLMVGEETGDMSRKARETITPLYCIKGKMTAVVGEIWRLKYELPVVDFDYDQSPKSPPTREQLTAIGEALKEDVTTVPVTFNDPYQFGKEISRSARLALIAAELKDDESKAKAVDAMERTLLVWLSGKNDDHLKYDTTYGGLVPSIGLGNKYEDYGAGWYSDHHFHYGYFIYAAAVLAKLDPKFVDTHRAEIETFIRDIHTVDSSDKEFPVVRHKDFFDGHSWASGLYPQANGKGQESSSEAVNAYYAVYLYAKATGKTELMSFAHLTLAMELHSTKTYWHMKSDSDVYDSVFAAGKMVGNIGALDVTALTWFGFEFEFVHGINIMPITPVTAVLLDREYVAEEWPVVGDTIPTPEEEAKMMEKASCSLNKQCATIGLGGDCCPAPSGTFLGCCDARAGGERPMQNDWRSLLYADLAVIDKNMAYEKLSAMKGYGTGGSRTNFLMWAATRHFPSGDPTGTHPVNYTAAIDPRCEYNSNCNALGLSGLCCPAANGMILGCCPKVVPTQADISQLNFSNKTEDTR